MKNVITNEKCDKKHLMYICKKTDHPLHAIVILIAPYSINYRLFPAKPRKKTKFIPKLPNKTQEPKPPNVNTIACQFPKSN